MRFGTANNHNLLEMPSKVNLIVCKVGNEIGVVDSIREVLVSVPSNNIESNITMLATPSLTSELRAKVCSEMHDRFLKFSQHRQYLSM